MKNVGLVIVIASVGFLLYWNFVVAGEPVFPGTWQYSFNEMPGSQWYAFVAGAIGYGLMKMGEPEEAQGEPILEDEDEPAAQEEAAPEADEEA